MGGISFFEKRELRKIAFGPKLIKPKILTVAKGKQIKTFDSTKLRVLNLRKIIRQSRLSD